MSDIDLVVFELPSLTVGDADHASTALADTLSARDLELASVQESLARAEDELTDGVEVARLDYRFTSVAGGTLYENSLTVGAPGPAPSGACAARSTSSSCCRSG